MKAYTLPPYEIALRLVVSALLGGLVGWDRQRKESAAGLRTHMLVCVGSALVMIVSVFGFEDILGRPDVVLDPSRIAAQVVSGIGFLGAGTILFLRQQVLRGLTTAAGLWSVAAVGLAVGSGLYIAAVLTTVIIVIILAIIKPLEGRLFKRGKQHTIYMVLDLGKTGLLEIEAMARNKGLEIGEIVMHDHGENSYYVKLSFDLASDRKMILMVMEQLAGTPGVSKLNMSV